MQVISCICVLWYCSVNNWCVSIPSESVHSALRKRFCWSTIQFALAFVLGKQLSVKNSRKSASLLARFLWQGLLQVDEIVVRLTHSWILLMVAPTEKELCALSQDPTCESKEQRQRRFRQTRLLPSSLQLQLWPHHYWRKPSSQHFELKHHSHN